MCLVRVISLIFLCSTLLTFPRVLSVKGNKVLHIDRNDHYGGEAASVNIETVCTRIGYFKVLV